MSTVPVSAAPSPAPAAAAAADSAIADVSYRNYDGELRARTLRWWTIAVAGMRASVNRKRFGYWIPAGIIGIIYFFLGVAHYLTQGVRARMEEMNPFMSGPAYNPYAMTLYQGATSTTLLVFIATLTIGAAAISADNRANALLVYLSKPITRIDYLLGKWAGIFLLIAALTVTPPLLMYLFFAVTYNDEGFLHTNAILLPRLLEVALISAAINTSLIVGFSAWSKSPRLAGALYAAFYFMTAILSGVFGQVMLHQDTAGKHPEVTAVVAKLSVDGVVKGLAMNVFDVTPQEELAKFEAGARRRRRMRQRVHDAMNGEAAPAADARRAGQTPEESDAVKDGGPPPPAFMPHVPDRPSLPAMLAAAAAMILLPLAAAMVRIRAVEVIRG